LQNVVSIIKKLLSNKDKSIDKNIVTKKKYGTKRLLAEFPDKHWPLTNVKRLQLKNVQQTNNLAVEENEKLLKQ